MSLMSPRPSRRAFLVLVALLGAAPSASAKDLDALEKQIAEKFPAVSLISGDELETLIEAQSGSVVLLDVRETAEVAVSRIPGSRHLKPGASVSEALGVAGDVKGKTVAFYCAVGYRSSVAATAAQKAMLDAGAARVVNLKGGIFGWHNAGRGLVSGTQPTPYVHPFSSYYQALLSHPELARMAPEPAAAAAAQ